MMEDDNSNTPEHNERQHHQHNDLYHIVYVAGATILLGVVDFVFLYPENHLLSFLILSAWLSLPAIYELHSRGLTEHILPTIGAIFCIPLAMFAIIGPNLAPDMEITGALKPGVYPTPLNACTTIAGNMPGDLTIIAGSQAFILGARNNEYRMRIGTCNNIVIIRRAADGLSIDASIYNEESALLGNLRDNNYDIIIEGGSTKKRPDLSTIGVIDSSQKERLWVRYLNRAAAQFRGIFFCPGSMPVIITDDASIFGNETRAANCVIRR